MRPDWSDINIFPSKIRDLICIEDLDDCKYLFYHPEYEVKHIFQIWLVIDICFLI